jgi:hypothetical protein
MKEETQLDSILGNLLFCCTAKSFNPQYLMWATLKDRGIDLQPKEHRIFISGPMTGYVGHNYNIFEKVEKCLRTAGYECVNPAAIGKKYNPEKVDKDKSLYCAMEKEIQESERTCNVLLLLPGWEDSIGVRLELRTAIELKMKIIQWRN